MVEHAVKVDISGGYAPVDSHDAAVPAALLGEPRRVVGGRSGRMQLDLINQGRDILSIAILMSGSSRLLGWKSAGDHLIRHARQVAHGHGRVPVTASRRKKDHSRLASYFVSSPIAEVDRPRLPVA